MSNLRALVVFSKALLGLSQHRPQSSKLQNQTSQLKSSQKMARQRSVQGLITTVSVNVVLMENVLAGRDVHLKSLPVGAVGEGYLVEVVVTAAVPVLEIAVGQSGHGSLQGA